MQKLFLWMALQKQDLDLRNGLYCGRVVGLEGMQVLSVSDSKIPVARMIIDRMVASPLLQCLQSNCSDSAL